MRRICLRLLAVVLGVLLFLLAVPWMSIWITRPEDVRVIWEPHGAQWPGEWP